MASEYITVQGDMVDLIAFRAYGHHLGTTEAVLAANPHIAALPDVLPAGTRITLPVVDRQATPRRKIRLWD
jgi:phage tail protein X